MTTINHASHAMTLADARLAVYLGLRSDSRNDVSADEAWQLACEHVEKFGVEAIERPISQ